MNPIHPLEYFYDLIAAKQLAEKRGLFFERQDNDPDVSEVNIKEDYIIGFDPDSSDRKHTKIYFKEVLKRECTNAQNIALKKSGQPLTC